MGFFLELDWSQRIKHGQNISGDRVFMMRLEDRDVIILSDGLGSGIKANVLATLTGEMAKQYVKNNLDLQGAAKIIMDTLPVCNLRKISYATFTICEVYHNGLVKLVEYDNPPSLHFRGRKHQPIIGRSMELNRAMAYKKEILHYSEFQLIPGDRLVFYSDGVSQSGMGSRNCPLGWRDRNVIPFIEEKLTQGAELSAGDLARSVCSKAVLMDGSRAKDDITCAVVYYRRPREILVITGPPMDSSMDGELARRVEEFDGPVILSGGTTASILSRELNRPLTLNLKERTRDIPPTSSMEGISLVTEGMLTLNRVAEILEGRSSEEMGAQNGAALFCRKLMQSDRVHFLVGTRVNEAHHHPSIPHEIGIRRTIIKRIGNALQQVYLKKYQVDYL